MKQALEEGPQPSTAGVIIINADDWGRSRETTDRIFDCTSLGSVSSVSAMVFMEDSERAAAIARENNLDAGLHLNFTTSFAGSNPPARLVEQQGKLSQVLLRHRLAQVMFHPALANAFEYVVAAQIEEFTRTFGAPPLRIDGHHHMHLCTDVVIGKLLPDGVTVRRNFSFQSGEKSLFNRFYRGVVDRQLAHRHSLTDYFFSLAPLEPRDRLQKIFSLGRENVIEVETHPVNPDEHRFLTQGELFRMTEGVRIAHHFEVRSNLRSDSSALKNAATAPPQK